MEELVYLKVNIQMDILYLLRTLFHQEESHLSKVWMEVWLALEKKRLIDVLQVGSLQRTYGEASLGWLSPAALTAVTLNMYSLPSNRPEIFRRVS